MPQPCRSRRCPKRRRPSSSTRSSSDPSFLQTCRRLSWRVPAAIHCMPRSSRGWWRSAEILPDDGELDVPDSVQGLISARLDSLAREEKELLQDAAVLGKVFWPGALIADRDSSAIDEALRALERKEFVRRERRSSVEGELQYAFRHVLVRDVAYAQIPRATRADRHEQVAEWIEGNVRGKDAAELLAHHYTSALEYTRAAGRDATAVTGRARLALRDAGRHAVALDAFTNAVRFFEAAVELTAEADPDWPRLVLEHAEAAVYVDVTSDGRLFRAREALLAGDVHDAARAEMLFGEYRWLRWRPSWVGRALQSRRGPGGPSERRQRQAPSARESGALRNAGRRERSCRRARSSGARPGREARAGRHAFAHPEQRRCRSHCNG